jgi:hypothetical protein
VGWFRLKKKRTLLSAFFCFHPLLYGVEVAVGVDVGVALAAAFGSGVEVWVGVSVRVGPGVGVRVAAGAAPMSMIVIERISSSMVRVLASWSESISSRRPKAVYFPSSALLVTRRM